MSQVSLVYDVTDDLDDPDDSGDPDDSEDSGSTVGALGKYQIEPFLGSVVGPTLPHR